MDYKQYLESVCESPEIAEQLFTQLMKKLNDVTFNGKSKIEKVSVLPTIAIKLKGFDTFTEKVKSSSYWIGVSKCAEAVLD